MLLILHKCALYVYDLLPSNKRDVVLDLKVFT